MNSLDATLLDYGAKSYTGPWKLIGLDYRVPHGHGKFTYETDQLTYEGSIENGKAHGLGRRVWSDGYYEGEWFQGRMTGAGVFAKNCGRIYVGGFLDNKQHGRGISGGAGFQCYDGEWQHGLKSGEGVMHFDTGCIYIGHFKENKMHGIGSYTWNEFPGKDGKAKVYNGEWKCGKMSGHGIMECERGSYTGEWSDGQENGAGVFVYNGGIIVSGIFKDGLACGVCVQESACKTEVYKGNFKNGLRDGYGILSHETGCYYDGNFKENAMHGHGEYYWVDLKSACNFVPFYIGEFEKGLQSGYGVFSNLRGVYEGFWKNGRKNGQGTYTYSNGDTLIGIYVDDLANGFCKSTLAATNEVFEGIFKNGVACLSMDTTNGV